MRCIFLLAVLFSSAKIYSQTAALRPGKHAITLQWISWDKPGTAQVTKTANGYRIVGRQRSADGRDSLLIDGMLRIAGARKLQFSGQIITAVHHIRGGEPCIRDGEYSFLATGTRRYWRLQQMLNCDGEVTDYVDIYF